MNTSSLIPDIQVACRMAQKEPRMAETKTGNRQKLPQTPDCERAERARRQEMIMQMNGAGI
jgi:hypothetical protein